MTATTDASTPSTDTKPREWAPRIWEGCDFFAWMKLLCRNRFHVDWPHLYIAVIVTFVSFWHTILRLVEQAIYGRRIARTKLSHPPIFIIGHWRTGTTLLHELLILDPRHTYPNTYQCLEPNHFLLTEGLITRWLYFLMPSKRPMDNMAAGWDRPQEEEFALCMMGVPSPYFTIAFPNHPPQCTEYFDLENISPYRLARWKKTFHHLLQKLTFKDPRRLVLKSPPHSCRIKVLLDMYPDAKFVHIVRNPYVLYPSTTNLWKSLYQAHSLQKPRFEHLDDYVLSCFQLIYKKIDEDRASIPGRNYHEIKYEELVADPIGQMRLLYDHLQLDGFENLLPRLESYFQANAGYSTNRYQLTPEQREKIDREWGWVIDKYGYRDADC